MFVALSDGTRIYYNVNGEEIALNPSRPVLIVLHGGPGLADHTLYLSFWSKLKEIIQVIFIDMRGHGRSDGHHDYAKWTLKQWGQDIRDFCLQTGICNPIVAGVSFGGWVALSYATQYPQHLFGLLLCHTEARVDIEIRKMAYARKARKMLKDPNRISKIVQDIYDWCPGVDTKSLYLEECIPLYSTKPYSPADFAACIRNLKVWEIFGRSQYTFDFLPELHLIKSPVLILTGEDDPEHPPEFARQMHERIQSSSLFIISGVGVPTYREKEQETLEILSSEISAWCLKWR